VFDVDIYDDDTQLDSSLDESKVDKLDKMMQDIKEKLTTINQSYKNYT
jgi:hypothetical protein